MRKSCISITAIVIISISSIFLTIVMLQVLSVTYLSFSKHEDGLQDAVYNEDSTSRENDSSSDLEDFELAYAESLGFFNDVSSAHWKKLKEKVKWQSPNYNPWSLPHINEDTGKERTNDWRAKHPAYFYTMHYHPDFVCQHERRIGQLGDGGKYVCDPHRIKEKETCLVYSVGSNDDFTFEEAVQKEIGAHCEIHTFDFGNYAAGAQKAGVHYHQVGLGIDDPPKFKSLSTIVKELGHEGRTIDIFKIDCEGCEWATSKEWFLANVTMRQIQVELHKPDVQITPKFFDLMYQNNYVITHKEPNILYPGSAEYAFLKLSTPFFEGYVRPNGASL
eukprot:CAMPEP_0194271106 /NCGR_PEP_ID=MMETSP0169-20130528/4976_1 /TAXON_ID=218684 /ORGANISM="Corethron pennatum, Strain L29A3" /LENGTH=332 /DNA_ID=CAMNT_0039013383 /DNA_START=153 /DNA_END=1148 /DNA_ORIENTATION=+